MSKITIGQHYPTNSIIHCIDPRVKLIGAFAHITVLLLVTNFVGYALAALYVVAIIKLSKVPPRLLLRSLRVIVFMLTFAVGLNLFLTPGETYLFQLWFISMTLEGVVLAGLMASRLIILVVGTSLLTLSTSPVDLTDGIESLLKPFKYVKLPVHDIAMMMTIALRFIPILADELDKIIKAQKARGADFDTGNIVKRAKSMLPILIPLFVSAFKRAEELATAMEARCYRGDTVGRTKMKEMKMVFCDWVALGIIVAISVTVVLTRFM